jgi:hypothetical protein
MREKDHLENPVVDGRTILRLKWDVGAWTGLSWLRIVKSAVMKFRIPQNAGNFLTSLEPVTFSTRTLLHGLSK